MSKKDNYKNSNKRKDSDHLDKKHDSQKEKSKKNNNHSNHSNKKASDSKNSKPQKGADHKTVTENKNKPAEENKMMEHHGKSQVQEHFKNESKISENTAVALPFSSSIDMSAKNEEVRAKVEVQKEVNPIELAAKAEEIKEDTNTEEKKAEEEKTKEKKVEEKKPEEKNLEEKKPEETKAEEKKPEEIKAEVSAKEEPAKIETANEVPASDSQKAPSKKNAKPEVIELKGKSNQFKKIIDIALAFEKMEITLEKQRVYSEGLKKDYDDLQKTREDLEADLKKYQNLSKQKQAEIDQLNELLEQKNAEIEHLNADVSQRDEVIDIVKADKNESSQEYKNSLAANLKSFHNDFVELKEMGMSEDIGLAMMDTLDEVFKVLEKNGIAIIS